MRSSASTTMGGEHIYTFQNYHKHTYHTNPLIADSVTSNEDYAKRAAELGHGIISIMEHGWQGRYIEGYELAEKYGLKFVVGAEAYWVKDRTEKDSSNCHIYLGAKNENGRQCLNDVLAEANITGFYRRPRVDVPLLLSLPADDIIVTTACLAYWQYDDVDDITLRLRDHFKDNFFLEVQYHNVEKQRRVNEHVLELSKKYGIPLIMGCDSHYILPPDAQERSDYIKSKGIDYPDEDGFILDYPDGDEAYRRFSEQCVLSHSDIIEAMENTNVFLQVEDYDNACFTKDIKMPSLHPDWTQEQKDAEYDHVIWEAWGLEKQKISADHWPHYEDEIRKEVDIVHQTKHADYFLDDKAIVERGRELGGVLTKTGRGSAVSFYTNKLLGLTDVDRIAAKVKMYPERFMSPTRILQAKTLADVDLNVADREPFLQAQKDIMGQESSYEMIAYGTLKPKAAWKMYAKSQGVDFDLANEVSDQIERYENALKHAGEDEKDDINVLDYIDPQYRELFQKSGKYQGIVSHMTPHPCATLLYQGNIRREIGLIRLKDKICCVMDGLWAEQYKFLKNDWLKVSVVELISKVYKRIGIPWSSEQELLAMCPPDAPVWATVYDRSCTLGINQVEQTGTAKRVSLYKPRNISELCAFVAAIRPGFKSMYKMFEERKHFEYGIPSLDNLLQTPEMPNSFILYQELSMAVLNYAGIPMSECYEIIKNIAKKRVEKVLKYKEVFLTGFSKALIEQERRTQEDAHATAEQVWQVIEDSSRYAFNCVSGDTVMLRSKNNRGFAPNISEMYRIKTDEEYAKRTGHEALHKKYKSNGYGMALSLCPDGKIRKNKIVDIYPMGVRSVYKITMESGRTISCTEEHKFPTPHGETRLRDLRVGDALYCIGAYQKSNLKFPFTDGTSSNAPVAGERGFQKRPAGDSVVYHAYRERCMQNRRPCDDCGCPYNADRRFEVHHIDLQRTHNTPGNYAWLCVSCHKKRHYVEGRKKQYENGIPSVLDHIVSVDFIGEQDVYDVEMEAPNHNYVIANGLITSNCSHSYCVAEDSLYTAWLKTNYPLQFYETFLRILEAKGDKDRMNAVKDEAEDYFHVRFLPYRFGQDNRSITADLEQGAIQNSLSAIKGFGKELGDVFYECGQQGFVHFVDVLRWLDARSIKAAKVAPLIKIDYFSTYGNTVELSRILSIFNFFKQGTAKTVKKDKVAGTAMEDLLRKYATDHNAKGQELKSYTITDMDGLLHEAEDTILSLHLPDVDLRTKMQNQLEILGYVELTTGKEEDRRKLLVTDCVPLKGKTGGDVWGYAIFTRSIGSGKTSRLTLRARLYNANPIKKSDIIYASNVGKERDYWYLYEYEKVM